MAGCWHKEDELIISVKVNKDSLLGLIAKAKAQMEDLNNTIVQLKYALEAEEVKDFGENQTNESGS